MRHWLFATAFLCCIHAFAADDMVRGEVLVTSNYVWRGLSLSEDAPSIIGGFDYRRHDDWFASAHIATVRVEGNPEQEAILRVGFSNTSGDWLFDAGAVFYEYTRGDRYNPDLRRLEPGTANTNDFNELFAGIGYGNFQFRYYRSEDYLGTRRLSNYYDFNYAVPLQRHARLTLHYGFLDSPAVIDHASQLSDTAFGISQGPFSFTITNLDDNEDGMQSRNPRFVISWFQRILL